VAVGSIPTRDSLKPFNENESFKMIAKVDVKVAAAEFVSAATKDGWRISIKSDSVVAISKNFTPNDMKAYVDADMMAYVILSHVPLKGGSVWGSTSDGIGGIVAARNGHYVLNKSGSSGKKFLAAVSMVLAKKF